MFGLKKRQDITVVSPAAGRLMGMDKVPDPVFSRRLMGDGFAVDLADGEIHAPASGEIVLIADTLHAFAIRTPEGAEILVHIGIDTVTLRGEGFRAHRSVGDQVAQGDPVISADLDAIRSRVPSLVCPVVITNGKAFTIRKHVLDAVEGQPVLVLDKV